MRAFEKKMTAAPISVRFARWVIAFSIMLYATSGVSAQTGRDTLSRQRPDTVVKTAAERIRDRLRALPKVGQPDSILPDDTARAQPQQIRINGMDASGGRPGSGRPGGGRGDMGLPAVGRDSIWEALLKLAGYNATEYKGDTASFRADSGNLNLLGNALVSREGQQVEAGKITYADSISLVCGYGKPKVSGAGTATPLESDSLCYDIERRYGVARGATTTISEGALWRMYSTTLVTRGDDYYSSGAKFSDCDMPWDDLHYAFTAKKVMAKRNNVLVARDVTLRFADVPVFWLPFMVQSLSQGRRSGILMPRFGVNDIARTSTRYSRRIEDIGFYWAVNDYMGAEVAFDWMSNNWTALRGSYDYNFLDKFIRGGLTVKRFWKNEGGSELTLASQNSWEPNERTRIQADANYSSSSAFVKQRTFDPTELNRSIDSNFRMSRRLDWGQATLGASRKQFLSDNTVTQVFPSLGINVSPITLFKALPGEERFYSNATFNASSEFRKDGTAIGDENTNPTAQSRGATVARVSGSFGVGNLSLRQSYSMNDQHTDAREIPLATGDSVRLLEATSERRNAWNVGIEYMQHIVGSFYLRPQLGLDGESLRNNKTGGQFVTAPGRMNFGASIGGDLYRVIDIPAGPFAKFRHKISPSFGYSYSPKPQADSLQQAVFAGFGNTLEKNALTIGLNQTFEAKMKAQRDTTTLRADSAAADTATGPQHRKELPGMMLLSISTDAIVYDFTQRREFGQGFATPQLRNAFRSDLLSGLTFDITHDLFEPVPRGDGAPLTPGDRKFKPHLSGMNASFQLTGQSRLFRMFGLGKRDSMPIRPGEPSAPDAGRGGVSVDRTQQEFGMVGGRRMNPIGTASGPTGAWRLDLKYSLIRPREGVGVPNNSLYQPTLSDQQVNVSFDFQPTANWTATWITAYSVTSGRFNDHHLDLTRKLHDWDARFSFVKAQNGNFSFMFNVFLRANPDIKLDWSQNEPGSGNIPRSRIR